MNNINVLILLFLSVNLVNSAIQLDSSCLKRPQACDDDAFSVADYLICSGSAFPEKENTTKGSGYRGSCSFPYECTDVFPTGELDSSAEAWGSNATATCDSDKIVLNNIYSSTLSDKTWSLSDTKDGTFEGSYTTQWLAEKIAKNSDYTNKWVKDKSDENAEAKKIGTYNDLLTNEKVVLEQKKLACQKWLQEGTGVCIMFWWFWPLIILVIVIIAVAVFVYWWKKKNKGSGEPGTNNSKTPSESDMLFSRNKYKRRGARVFDDGI